MFVPLPTQATQDSGANCKKKLRQITSSTEIDSVMHQIITSDPDFHEQVLRYQPVYISKLNQMLSISGYKCSANNLLDYLDRQVCNVYLYIYFMRVSFKISQV